MARRPLVDVTNAELEPVGLGSTIAVGLVGLVALSLAVIPALVALRFVAFPGGSVAVVIGCVGAAVTGVRLIAIAWAFGARLSRRHRPGGAVAFSD